jgi:hypothetical protein
MNFLDLFKSQLGAGQIDALSNALGADNSQTSAALGTFVPLIVSALARNTSTPEGANALSNALDKDHDGGILSMLPALLNNPAIGKGDGILGHVLGGKRPVAEQAVSQSSGLSLESTGKLFTMVAPMILGMIGAKKRQDGFGSDILAGMLRQFSNTHEQDDQQPSSGGGLMDVIGGMVAGNAGGGGGGGLMDAIGGMMGGNAGGGGTSASGMGGFISAILDRDHDGNVMDDIGGMIGGMMGGKK